MGSPRWSCWRSSPLRTVPTPYNYLSGPESASPRRRFVEISVSQTSESVTPQPAPETPVQAGAAPAQVPAVPQPQRLTITHWLILIMASIGFAFDIYVLLVMPLINRPALAELLQVDPDTDSGTQAILSWTST